MNNNILYFVICLISLFGCSEEQLTFDNSDFVMKKILVPEVTEIYFDSGGLHIPDWEKPMPLGNVQIGIDIIHPDFGYQATIQMDNNRIASEEWSFAEMSIQSLDSAFVHLTPLDMEFENLRARFWEHIHRGDSVQVYIEYFLPALCFETRLMDQDIGFQRHLYQELRGTPNKLKTYSISWAPYVKLNLFVWNDLRGKKLINSPDTVFVRDPNGKIYRSNVQAIR